MGRDPPNSWYEQTPLPREAARLLWWGLATKTRKTYSISTKAYTSHCAMHGHTPPFPALIASLASWIAALSAKRVQSKTIKSYLTGLRSAHVDLGYEDLAMFQNAQLQRIIAGNRRLHGEADLLERRPITRDLLLQILPFFDRNTKKGATLHAAFCLAFAAFLRIGEFTYTARDRDAADFSQWFLTRRSVRLHQDHLELTLPVSKTDPFRRGITLTVAAAGDQACAVRSLRHLFKWKAAPYETLFQIDGSFTRQMVTSQLRQILKSLGVEGHYSGHSFRRGAATSARNAGLSEEEIQLLGRWKSDSYRLYIVTHPARILSASQRHQQSSHRR